jgi:RNA polymerase sigma-70 factor (ECF subfamily)
MERYSGAVHRYLLGALRDPEAADELFQEFCLRFLRGAFRNADPARGRFRDLVKTAVFHLIVDYRKRERAQPRPLDTGFAEPEGRAPAHTDAERAFLESWREELMDCTWGRLAELEQQTGQPCYTVLRFRAEEPKLSSAQMAEQLGTRLGKTFSVDGVRQALHRAREKFTDLLLEEVARSLGNPAPEALQDELIDLGLHSYCQAALERRGRR